MAKGIGDKKGKVGSIKTTDISSAIEKAGAVSEVEKAKKTAAVAGVRGASGIGGLRGAQALTAAERAQLHQMIEEEADKLFSGDKFPKNKKDVVQQAVKMTIDAAIPAVEEEDEQGAKHKKK